MSKSQNEIILEHMQAGKKITQAQAVRLYKCYRLGARIWELKRRGYPISDKLVTFNNKTFSEYWIENAKQN